MRVTKYKYSRGIAGFVKPKEIHRKKQSFQVGGVKASGFNSRVVLLAFMSALT